MAKSVEDTTRDMIANLPNTTGKSLEQWRKIVAAAKLEKHGQIVAMLKADHGIGHGYANLIAHKSMQTDAGSAEGDDLVAGQYAGPKAALKPMYDKLVKICEGLGKDVEFAPKKAYVSLRRSKQFGLIQPSTATRLDLGLNLKGMAPKGKLEASGSFNAMVSHRVKLASLADIDDDVKKWIKAAYDLS